MSRHRCDIAKGRVLNTQGQNNKLVDTRDIQLRSFRDNHTAR